MSESRSLVKQGQLTRILTSSQGILDKWTRRKELLHLFLFNDILLITKKRGFVAFNQLNKFTKLPYVILYKCKNNMLIVNCSQCCSLFSLSINSQSDSISQWFHVKKMHYQVDDVLIAPAAVSVFRQFHSPSLLMSFEAGEITHFTQETITNMSMT